MGSDKPKKPLVFLKLPHSSVPPGGPVKRPRVVEQLDYEAELVLVLGPNHDVVGYAVADDVSARDLQTTENQWTRAKGFDSSCPWGPWITTADEVADAGNLRVTTHVNGEPRQDGNTSDLIFKPRELVAFIAETCTLEPGAIILTGTPNGVGAAMDPPTFLNPGDVVRVEVEGLGALEHPIQ
jgi:2-keto-4-pentenoate hydratase/2-oxohepta-3-ene-1,7-dioic acid hydratase in catechol pathway